MPKQKYIEELKRISKERLGTEYTDEEATEAAHNLTCFARILVDMFILDTKRKARLEKEPEGFHLEEGKGPYNCILCSKLISGKEGWWDQWGQKCLDCQRNIKEGVVPPEVCKDDKIWFTDWHLKSKFGIHPSTARKMRRLGELKARELKDEDGQVYFRVYLISENKLLFTPAGNNRGPTTLKTTSMRYNRYRHPEDIKK